MSFHTNLNVPDDHRRFCVIEALGMAEGNFVRGFLQITRRDGNCYADHDYSSGPLAEASAHYGADHMMVQELVAFLPGEAEALPVGITDALQAGIAALALDQAQQTGQVIDLGPIWKDFDLARTSPT